MATTVVWDGEPTPTGLGEVVIENNWTVIVDGTAAITNHQQYRRRDGGVTDVITIRRDAPQPEES